jgi:hypothetical protein
MVKDKFAISLPRRCDAYCLLHFSNAFQPEWAVKLNWPKTVAINEEDVSTGKRNYRVGDGG